MNSRIMNIDPLLPSFNMEMKPAQLAEGPLKKLPPELTLSSSSIIAYLFGLGAFPKMPCLSFRIKTWPDEKSDKLTTCGTKISRFRLEITVLRQPPRQASELCLKSFIVRLRTTDCETIFPIHL